MGNQEAGFEWLETVDEAYRLMLQAIAGAKESIRLEIYIFRESEIGMKFRDALIRARERGVKVSVLVDALGSISLPEKFWDSFVQAGGNFKWFNPLKFKRLGFRDHRKILVCDNKVGFIGGFNIAPEYEGDGVTKGWHDLGMRVPEDLARELAASFDMMYGLADYRHKLFTRYRRPLIARIADTKSGQLITSAPGRGPHYLKGALLKDLNQAPSIDIISAYFLPPRQMRRALVRAIKNKKRVRLILAAKSDVALSQLACQHLYQRFLRAGIEIYEYQPQIVHTKLFLFGDVFLVGSANMDKRSLLINYELLVRVKDATLAAKGKEFFERTLENCQKIELSSWMKQRSFLRKLREQWAFFMLSRVDPYLTTLQLNVLYRDVEEATGVSAAAIEQKPGR
ncbi:MAG: phospholipase D-like domain-containing protein [Verrucomicrobiales bacterium]